jgi:hypothetical protein
MPVAGKDQNIISSSSVISKQSGKRKRLVYAELPKISLTQIPPKSKASSEVQELLRQMNKGEAVILSEDQGYSLETIAGAVRRLRKMPEFKNFSVVRRTVGGVKKLYIANGNLQ